MVSHDEKGPWGDQGRVIHTKVDAIEAAQVQSLETGSVRLDSQMSRGQIGVFGEGDVSFGSPDVERQFLDGEDGAFRHEDVHDHDR